MASKLDLANSTTGDILNIQKLIVLLSKSTYESFLAHLRQSNSHLPARLIEAIRKKGFDFQSTEELCQLIYQKPASESKNNFYQLSTHTFRLSEFIALNYPSYLIHNITSIEELIAKQQVAEAQLLAKILLEVAEKINDFSTQMLVLRFLTNQEQIYKQPQKALYYYEQLKTSEENQRTLNDIYYMLRNDFNLVNVAVKKEPEEILRALEYLKGYFDSPCKSISILSRYASIYIRRYSAIEAKHIKAEIVEFEKELNNHSYILMPYLFDIKTSFSFILLAMPDFNVNDKEGRAQLNIYKKHYEAVGYWGSYLNIPKVYSIMMRAQDYLSRYSSLLHRIDYHSLIPAAAQAEITEMSEECLTLIAENEHLPVYIYDIMNLKVVVGGLLLLSGGEHIKEGVNHVEQSIISFQQMKKSRTIGNSYLILMIGYFMQADYKSCLATYTRYMKVSKNRDMYEQIDIKIQIYYNFARWLSETDPNCLNTIKQIYVHCCNTPSQDLSKILIERMCEYFSVHEVIESKEKII